MASATPLIVAVLDSDPDTIELLRSYFEAEGLVVATGSVVDLHLDHGSLVEFLQRAAPDVIVYDLGLPYDGNCASLKRAREDQGFPQCGLVVTTTNAPAVRSLLGDGADSVLGKPYDLSALMAAIRSAADGNGQRDNRRHGERRHGDRRLD